ncbi:hypothetical protein PIB30_062223 [Stylosanthes scabra]|uniref:Uncharacterized protein n=1 Tax=Stylosanthes scabra TaxID=79078 RepID=A0ABU6RLY6_9FABA|nr:hypothetical protein [Stylosanthes scabra]
MLDGGLVVFCKPRNPISLGAAWHRVASAQGAANRSSNFKPWRGVGNPETAPFNYVHRKGCLSTAASEGAPLSLSWHRRHHRLLVGVAAPIGGLLFGAILAY